MGPALPPIRTSALRARSLLARTRMAAADLPRGSSMPPLGSRRPRHPAFRAGQARNHPSRLVRVLEPIDRPRSRGKTPDLGGPCRGDVRASIQRSAAGVPRILSIHSSESTTSSLIRTTCPAWRSTGGRRWAGTFCPNASRSGSVKAGWMVTRAVDGAVVVIGHLPAGLRPGRLGQRRIPAIERRPNVSFSSGSLDVTDRNLERGQSPESAPDRRIRSVGRSDY
jgi:hypothetical protein